MWRRRATKLATEENFPSYAAGVDKGAEERRKAGSGQDEGRRLDIVPGNWSALARTSAGPGYFRVLPLIGHARVTDCGRRQLPRSRVYHGRNRKVRGGFRKRAGESNGPASFTIA